MWCLKFGVHFQLFLPLAMGFWVSDLISLQFLWAVVSWTMTICCMKVSGRIPFLIANIKLVKPDKLEAMLRKLDTFILYTVGRCLSRTFCPLVCPIRTQISFCLISKEPPACSETSLWHKFLPSVSRSHLVQLSGFVCYKLNTPCFPLLILSLTWSFRSRYKLSFQEF